MEQIYTLVGRVKGQIHDEDGAITVDWVALTALIMIIAMGGAFVVGAGIPDLADNISVFMENTKVTG